jgi:predicted ArsR family transcriptional regulator
MQTSKEQILTHLKRAGSATVDGLANALGLARMTVRQHLTALERDGLVASREERQRTGRPHLVSTLSDSGEEFFPKRYDRLAGLVLQEVALLDADEIAGLTAQEKKQVLLSKMAERVFKENESVVQGKTLAERVAAATRILQDEGGFAEWKGEDKSFEIINYNCVYRRVAGSHGDLCQFDMSLISRLLGEEVRCDQFMSQGAENCRFIVQQQEG